MKVVIRVDASLMIGSGHVMRCLVLADALAARGACVRFVCREHPGHLGALVVARGHAVSLLATIADAPVAAHPAHAHWLGANQESAAAATLAIVAQSGGADLLVVAHYALDATFERALRPAVGRIAVIDDLADRPHDCDVLLDQNHGRDHAAYDGLVPKSATICVGPTWALLRPEFSAHRTNSLRRRGEGTFRTILVSMGGGDAMGLTSRALDALSHCRLEPSASIRVVLGPLAANRRVIANRAEQMPVPTTVLFGISGMAEEMAAADLAIGAGGTTSWERCCLGLPAVVSPVADNQREIIRELVDIGAVRSVPPDDRYELALKSELEWLLGDPWRLTDMSRCAAALCDGEGAIRFVDLIQREGTQQ